jgi:ABC-2 type transport system permease protein
MLLHIPGPPCSAGKLLGVVGPPATIPLPPSPLAVLSVGRSDLDTLAYRVETNTPPTPRREQTDYPLRLLMGHLDFAFVVLYLYPLFILALSYNQISFEREGGMLSLPYLLKGAFLPMPILAGQTTVVLALGWWRLGTTAFDPLRARDASRS